MQTSLSLIGYSSKDEMNSYKVSAGISPPTPYMSNEICDDLTVDPYECLRMSVQVQTPFLLLFCQAAIAIGTQTANKSIPGNNIIQPLSAGLIAIQCAAQGESLEFSFLIAHNSGSILKWIQGLYVSTDSVLHSLKAVSDLGGVRE